MSEQTNNICKTNTKNKHMAKHKINSLTLTSAITIVKNKSCDRNCKHCFFKLTSYLKCEQKLLNFAKQRVNIEKIKTWQKLK